MYKIYFVHPWSCFNSKLTKSRQSSKSRGKSAWILSDVGWKTFDTLSVFCLRNIMTRLSWFGVIIWNLNSDQNKKQTNKQKKKSEMSSFRLNRHLLLDFYSENVADDKEYCLLFDINTSSNKNLQSHYGMVLWRYTRNLSLWK